MVRAEQLPEAAVVPQQGAEGLVNFLPRGPLHRVVEPRVEGLAELEEIQAVQRQPLGKERAHEVRGARVVQQAVGLGLQDLGPLELAQRGEIAQGAVRRGAPEEVREPGRELPAVERAAGGVGLRFGAVEEARGRQHGGQGLLERVAGRATHRAARRVEPQQPIHQAVGRRNAAVGLLREPREGGAESFRGHVRQLVVERQVERAEAGGQVSGRDGLALDLHPVDPDRHLGPVPVALHGLAEQLLRPREVHEAAFAHEQLAVVLFHVRPGEGERDLDHLRCLERAGDMMGAARGRAGTSDVGALQAEIQEAALRRGAGRGRGADADHIVPRREIPRDGQPRLGGESRAAEAEGLAIGAHGQVGAPVEGGQPQVVVVVADEIHVLPVSVDDPRVDLGLLAEAELHRARGARNLVPVETQVVGGRRVLPQLRHQRGVLGERRGVVHRLHPALHPLDGLQRLPVSLQERRMARFQLQPESPRRGVDGRCPEGLLERLERQRLIELELVAVHKQAGAHGVEVGTARVGRQRAHVDVDAEESVQRVRVLAAVEPAERDHAVLIGEPPARGDQRVRQVVEEIGLRVGRGLRLVLGRHLARVQRVEDLLPALRGGQIRQRQRQVVHPEPPLLLFRSVAPLAILGEKVPVPLRHRARGRVRRARGCPAGRKEQQSNADEVRDQAWGHGDRRRVTSPSRASRRQSRPCSARGS